MHVRFDPTILAGILLALLAAVPARAAATAVPAEVWPMFQYRPDHNAVFEKPDWNYSWKADIGGASNGGISIVGSTLYIDSFDHYVYALDATSGALRWKRKLPDVLMNVPIVVRGIVIVGTGHSGLLKFSDTFWTSGRPEGDSIFGLDARDGSIRWRFDTVGENMPTGVYVFSGGKPQFIFCGGDDHVYSLDPSTGTLIWEKRTLGISGMAALNLVDGQVVGETTLSDAGFFQAQASPGNVANYFNWTWLVDPAKGGQFTWQMPVGVGDASPLVSAGKVFVQGFRLVRPVGRAAAELSRTEGWANLGNSIKTRWATVVSALDARTGARLWSFVGGAGYNDTTGSAAFTSDATFLNGVVYEPLAFSRKLSAFAAGTGRMLWTIPTHGAIKTSPVVKDGYLYVGDAEGFFYVIQINDGHVVHEFHFAGGPSSRGFAKSPAIIVGNTLYVSHDRYVYALPVSDLNRGSGVPSVVNCIGEQVECEFPHAVPNGSGAWHDVEGGLSSSAYRLAPGGAITISAKIAKELSSGLASISLVTSNGYGYYLQSYGSGTSLALDRNGVGSILGSRKMALPGDKRFHSYKLTVIRGNPNIILGSIDEMQFAATDASIPVDARFHVVIGTAGPRGLVRDFIVRNGTAQ